MVTIDEFSENRAERVGVGFIASIYDTFIGTVQQIIRNHKKSGSRKARVAFLMALAGFTASCDVLDPIGDYQVDLSGSEMNLVVGEVRTAQAELLLNGVTIDETITFSSSSSSVATVDASGVVRAVGAGRATVRASARGQSDSIFVNVGTGSTFSISASPAALSFDALTATESPAVQAVNQFGATIPFSGSVQWESLDESVASVSLTGVVTAVGPGSTKVRASSGSFELEIPVAVNQVVTNIAVSGQLPRVFRGERVRLQAVARDRLGNAVADAVLLWSSQNESVATVDEDGWVQGLSVGATTISVSLLAPNPAPGGSPSGASPGVVSAVFPITVEASRVEGILMNPDSTTVYLGDSLPIGFALFNSEGAVIESEAEVIWSSTDQAVATVDANGIVTGVGVGYAEIIAQVEGASGVTLLQVLPPVEVPEVSLMAVTSSSASFVASPFAALPGAGHLVSEWQVAPIGHGFADPVSESGESGVALTSYGVSGLAPATTYEVRVRYRSNRGSWSAWSSPLGFTTPSPSNGPPNTPSLGSVTSVTQSSVVLNGSTFVDPDAGNTHASSQWQVDRSYRNFSNPIFDSEETSSSLTSYAVSGLSTSTSYRARVRYRDNNGNWSSWSVAVGFSTAADEDTPPDTPNITSVTSVGQTSVNLNGSSFSDPNPGNSHQSSQWQVDLSTGNYSSPVVNSGETSTSRTSFSVNGLSSGTAYRARVRYRDNTGNWSSWSSSYSFTTASAPSASPNTPSISSVSDITGSTATLNGSVFSDPNSGDSHQSSQWQVTRSGSSYFNPTVNSGETSSSLRSFDVTGLSAGTAYRARVRYRDSAGNWSSWSTSYNFTTSAPSNSAPNTPSISSVTSITATSATLVGSGFSDPDSGNSHQSSQWQVDLSSGNFSSPVVDSGETGSSLTSRNVSGLNASTGYRARVRYRDNNGNWSSWSASLTFTTAAAANVAPNTPSVNSVSSVSTTSATLNGSSFSDPNGGDTHQSSQWQVILNGGSFSSPLRDSGETTTSRTSYTVTGLTASTDYRGRVRYRDNNGSWSSWSSSFSFSTGAASNSAPNTPSVTSVGSITTTGATLNGSSFSDPNAGDSHQSSQWQVVLSGGSFSVPLFDSGETSTFRTSITVSGLLASTSYLARVRYRDSAGSWSSWSSSVSLTTLASSGGGGGGGGTGSGGAILQSNWSTATGTSNTALSDGGKMGVLGSGSVLAVVSGSSLGWNQTPNVLQVTNRGSESYGFVSNTLSLPSGTNEFFMRMYVRVDGADDGMTFHSVKLGFQTLDAAFWGIERPRGTTYDPRMRFANHTGMAPYGYSARNLQQGQWYRFEYRVHFYDPSNPLRVRIYPYVYDLAGNLVAGPDGWTDVDNSSRSIAAAYASGGYATFSSQSAIRDFFLGYEGTAGNSDTSARWYYAGVEVRTDRFPGPIQ